MSQVHHRSFHILSNNSVLLSIAIEVQMVLTPWPFCDQGVL